VAICRCMAQNEGFLSLGSHLFALLSGDAAEGNAARFERMQVLHSAIISCLPRVEQAQEASIPSRAWTGETAPSHRGGKSRGTGKRGFRFQLWGIAFLVWKPAAND